MKIYTGPTHNIRDLVHFRDEMMVALYGYIYIFGYLKSGLGDGGEERPLPSVSYRIRITVLKPEYTTPFMPHKLQCFAPVLLQG